MEWADLAPPVLVVRGGGDADGGSSVADDTGAGDDTGDGDDAVDGGNGVSHDKDRDGRTRPVLDEKRLGRIPSAGYHRSEDDADTGDGVCDGADHTWPVLLCWPPNEHRRERNAGPYRGSVQLIAAHGLRMQVDVAGVVGVDSVDDDSVDGDSVDDDGVAAVVAVAVGLDGLHR